MCSAPAVVAANSWLQTNHRCISNGNGGGRGFSLFAPTASAERERAGGPGADSVGCSPSAPIATVRAKKRSDQVPLHRFAVPAAKRFESTKRQASARRQDATSCFFRLGGHCRQEALLWASIT
ncbi:hypothetical protein GQ53DRAFT_755200 [Thozetella sp. PMI_491]|nr:hypothetical protein GQ53DRAFT_755200 [Thozetella sp. PMI_491]